MVRGDREKAIESYKSALAIDPAMESAKQALRKLTLP
jgi:predicted negative regulator of RcsB-dependent stress response